MSEQEKKELNSITGGLKKPSWLKIKLERNDSFVQTKSIVESHNLHTICSSGRCPNIGECWSRGTATFMIGGEICTRSCKFCNTKTGSPLALNVLEPFNVAKSIRLMKIRHAVITSVDRDDLPDFGAQHWATTIKVVRAQNPKIAIEVLVPDFKGDLACVDLVCDAQPDVMGHNMETVRRITPKVRSAGKYDVSLTVLERIAERGLVAKSGIMLGLGETEEEVYQVMDDLLAVGCSFLTIGQYLQPTPKHFPVQEYIHPDVFERLERVGVEKGFDTIVSGPLVRSSYHADLFNKKRIDKLAHPNAKLAGLSTSSLIFNKKTS